MSKWVLGLVFMSAAALADQAFDPDKHPEYQDLGGNPAFNYGNPPRWQYISDRFDVPNKKIHWVLRTREKVIWDIIITTDQHGRRVVPQEHLENRKEFLVMYGCSFTFGNGLNDDETFPSQLAKHLKKHHVYNLGVSGSGPHEMLEFLQKKQLASELKEKRGIFAYVHIDPHVGRANGFLAESSWGKNGPYYEYNAAGRLVRNGSFASAHPWRYKIYDWAWNWLALKLGISFNWPPLLPSHFKYVCDLIDESKREVETQFPGSRFVVIDHALSSMRPAIKACLAERGITVLSADPQYLGKDFFIPLDGHPSASFNKYFGEKIAAQLAGADK